jgi:PAP2 superfamily
MTICPWPCIWVVKAAVSRVRPWTAPNLPSSSRSATRWVVPERPCFGKLLLAAFLVTPLVASAPKPSWYARIASYSALVATAVVLSRVCLGAHFPNDVVAGAVLGAGVGDGGGSVRPHH